MAGPQPFQPSTFACVHVHVHVHVCAMPMAGWSTAIGLQPSSGAWLVIFDSSHPAGRPPTPRNKISPRAQMAPHSSPHPRGREGGCQDSVSDTPAGRGAAGGGPQGVAELLRACRESPKRNSGIIITTRRRASWIKPKSELLHHDGNAPPLRCVLAQPHQANRLRVFARLSCELCDPRNCESCLWPVVGVPRQRRCVCHE